MSGLKWECTQLLNSENINKKTSFDNTSMSVLSEFEFLLKLNKLVPFI